MCLNYEIFAGLALSFRALLLKYVRIYKGRTYFNKSALKLNAKPANIA